VIRFSLGPVTAEYLSARAPVYSRAEVHCHVEADLTITEDGRVLYAEILFPVLELAAALRRWRHTHGPFAFTSDAFAAPWALRFLPVGPGWQVVVDGDSPAASSVVPVTTLDAAIADFTAAVHASSVELLGDWVEAYLD
jgi:hypothetical protein